MQAIITDLVFEHALRIRVKAGTADADDSDASDGATSRDETVVEAVDLPEEAPADTNSTSNTPAKGKGKSTGAGEAGPGVGAAKADRGQGNAGSAHLIGRINNLVSGDLRTLDDLSQYTVFFSRSSCCARYCRELTRAPTIQRSSGRSR